MVVAAKTVVVTAEFVVVTAALRGWSVWFGFLRLVRGFRCSLHVLKCVDAGRHLFMDRRPIFESDPEIYLV